MKTFKISASSTDLRRAAAALLFWAFIAFAGFYVVSEALQVEVLSRIFPSQSRYTHQRLSLLQMSIDHLLMASLATAISSVVGFTLGILITHTAGRDFFQLVNRINSLVQTFPPSAVIILAYPLLGFGWMPTLLALFFYSLFPIIGNTVVGFQAVEPAVKDAAAGLGMREFERLRIVELPIALPYIITGLRHAFILNLATAAIGAVIGAGGLGVIIMSGLVLQNTALVFSGTLVIAACAFLSEKFFTWLQARYTR